MSNAKRRRLDSAITAIQQRHGRQAVRKARDLPTPRPPPGVATSFPALDAITGCGGIPRHAITLIDGESTSGKLTLGYKVLAHAQRPHRRAAPQPVAIVDLNGGSDPDYLLRCDIDLDRLLIAQPPPDGAVADLILALVRTQQLRAVLVDNLADLMAQPAARRAFNTSLKTVGHALRQADCALLLLDEPSPPWQRWLNLDRSGGVRRAAALHLAVRREQWLQTTGEFVGYRALVQVMKSRWTPHRQAVPIEVIFNGTVRARETW
jgi:recombination protein RecA